MKRFTFLVAIATILTITALPAHANVDAMPDGDFSGDGKTEIAVLRYGYCTAPDTKEWWILPSNGSAVIPETFGFCQSRALAADFDGDGRTDRATWNPSCGFAYLSPTEASGCHPWGTTGDDPTVVADYDGDGRADPAVYRHGYPSTWWIHGSRGTDVVIPWGEFGDRPVPGDYDGDGRADVAIARLAPDGSLWFWINRTTTGFALLHWGQTSDQIVPTDFDGDGATDITVVRDTGGILTWYTTNGHGDHAAYFGEGPFLDVPAPGDYDGDGTTDLAVWRHSSPGRFYILNSRTGTMTDQAWGEPGLMDFPIVRFNVH